MRPRSTATRLSLAAALLGALACGPELPPNVVLISIDTLRADALGPYGGVPTPTIERLAAGGVLFESAFAPTPTTAPSHATLFTGQDPLRHGLLRNGDSLPESATTLAEAFRAAGYHTAAFVSSFVLDPRFGWAQGFEHYDADLPQQGATLKKAPYPGAFWAEQRFDGFDRRATATTQAARAWLEKAPEPFFLFVHYFDPHAPYLPPDAYLERIASRRFPLDHRALPGLTPAQLERLVRRYHGEVMYTDDSLGALLDGVAERRSRRSTLTVVVGDHGEGLGQHRWLEHALYLYDEQIHVPLVVHWPGHLPAGRRLRAQVGLVDLAPTLVELAGLPPLAPIDGRSLAAALRGGAEPESRPLFGQRHLVAETTGWDHGIKSSVRTPQWKYIRAPEAGDELYDLRADPGELQNVLEVHPEVAAALRGLLETHVAALPGAAPAAPLSEETRRALHALGYVD